MGNMSYCRFENTLADLKDCAEHLDDDVEELSKTERISRAKLIRLCKQIADANDEGDD